jgi:hypothetical protein
MGLKIKILNYNNFNHFKKNNNNNFEKQFHFFFHFFLLGLKREVEFGDKFNKTRDKESMVIRIMNFHR